MRISRDFRHGLLLSAAAYGAFAGGYVYHVISSRWLGPADYAVVGAAGSVLNTLFLAMGAVELACTRSLAASYASSSRLAVLALTRRWRAGVLRIGGVGTFILALAAVPISRLLHLDSSVPLLLVAASVPFLGLATWQRALYRSADAFEAIALRIILEKVLTIVGTVALLGLGVGAVGAVAALAASSWAWLPWGAKCSPPDARPVDEMPTVRLRGGAGAGSMGMIYLTMGVIANLDVLVVQARYPGDVAGRYAVVALFGRALFLGILTMTGALVPKVALAADARETRVLLGQYAGLGIALAAAAIVVADRFGSVLLGTVFGAAYAPAAGLLTLQMTFATLVGVQGLVSCYAHARHLPGALTGQLASAALTATLLLGIVEIAPMLRAVIAGQVVCLAGYGLWLLARGSARDPRVARSSA